MATNDRTRKATVLWIALGLVAGLLVVAPTAVAPMHWDCHGGLECVGALGINAVLSGVAFVAGVVTLAWTGRRAGR